MKLQVEARIRRAGGFNLDVACSCDGDALGIVGPSGSGKTTLLEAIAGMAPAVRVALDGRDLSPLPLHRREIGYVMQDALLFPHLSVRRNIEFSRRAKNVERIAAILHIDHLLERMPRHLSGGERRRAALARALAAQPALLLLDEPFAGLDEVMRREALSLLDHTRRVLGTPIVLVSHQPDEIVALTDYALRLDGGRIVAQGRSNSVLRGGETRIDNYWSGTVNGPGRVRVEGVELACVLPDLASGDVRLACYAHDIVVATARPEMISARNILQVNVMAEEPAGNAVLLSMGPPRMRVLVTREACRSLRLEPGRPAFAVIKATSIEHLGPV